MTGTVQRLMELAVDDGKVYISVLLERHVRQPTKPRVADPQLCDRYRSRSQRGDRRRLRYCS